MTEKEKLLLCDSWAKDALRDQIRWARATGTRPTKGQEEYFSKGWLMGWRQAVALAELHCFLKVKKDGEKEK